MLAGDLITRALRFPGRSIFDLDGLSAAVAELDQGGTDARYVAEFLAYDIPFETEPATGVIFPAGVDRG